MNRFIDVIIDRLITVFIDVKINILINLYIYSKGKLLDWNANMYRWIDW